MTIAAYQRTDKVAESPRLREARILMEISHRLVKEAEAGRVTPGLATALQDNSRFWNAVIQDINSEGNTLPRELKAQLVSIGFWMTRAGMTAVRDLSQISAIVDINKSIATGLYNSVSAASEPQPASAPQDLISA